MDYYNEFDPYAAQWLRNLIEAGHLPKGIVDDRSISDVAPNDLKGFRQCHFFAGIGVWAYALERAGWPAEQRVWTGSCPCQPFSDAGVQSGFSDERHLWPHFHWLINKCRPPVVLGEQVASAVALDWLDLVLTDLEGTGYSAGAADLCAAGVGAPHIRQRLYWMGHANDAGLEGLWRGYQAPVGRFGTTRSTPAPSESVRMADNDHERRDGQHALLHRDESRREPQDHPQAPRCGEDGRMADPECHRPYRTSGDAAESCGNGSNDGVFVGSSEGLCRAGPGPINGFWGAADWLACRDGRWRPVEPGTFPLAAGSPARVGRLRAYGNAINSACAEEFIEAVMEVLKWRDGGE